MGERREDNGYEAFKEFFKALGVEVVEVNRKKFREPQEELVEDLITIITLFAGKLYGLKSHKTKRIVEKVKEELNEC